MHAQQVIIAFRADSRIGFKENFHIADAYISSTRDILKSKVLENVFRHKRDYPLIFPCGVRGGGICDDGGFCHFDNKELQ